MSRRAVWEVQDCLCKTLTLPDNLDQHLASTEVPEQISHSVVGKVGMNRIGVKLTPNSGILSLALGQWLEASSTHKSQCAKQSKQQERTTCGKKTTNKQQYFRFYCFQSSF